MAQPNFNISDLMHEYLYGENREKHFALAALREYRKNHPSKFMATLKWFSSKDTHEFEKINGITSLPTERMLNVFEGLKQGKYKWRNHLFPLHILEVFDWRCLNGLVRRGMLDIHYCDHDGIGKNGYYLKPWE